MTKIFTTVCFLVSINLPITTQHPVSDIEEMKSTYKAGLISDLTEPITLEKIKKKLKERGIFDSEGPNLSERQREEMGKFMEALEIVILSRQRQPNSAQKVLSPLQLVERVLKKLLKEGVISEALVQKFNWGNEPEHPERETRSWNNIRILTKD